VAESSDGQQHQAAPTDADRDLALQRLVNACAEGRITLGEFERRVEAVIAATSPTHVDQAVRDLPVLALVPSTAVARSVASDRRWSLSVVGGLRRRGGWQLPKHLIHVSLIGRASIDLGEAELADSETTITLVSLIGGADLRLPKAVRSELSGFSVFGGRHVTGSPYALPEGPLVHLRVFSLIGGATIRPSGSRWRRFALTR
jgi:hypothetical protein